jgi:hypothetical protein
MLRLVGDVNKAFELDPCAADPRPWECAEVNPSEAEDGLRRAWTGRVSLNPPFDRYVVARLAAWQSTTTAVGFCMIERAAVGAGLELKAQSGVGKKSRLAVRLYPR